MALEETGITYPRLCVIGTGVIGCSVACIAKGRGIAEEVVGVDRDPAHLEMARRLGFIDRGMDDLSRGVMGARLVVIAVPLHEVFIVAETIAKDLRPDALLTCTAGTTARVHAQIASAAPQAAGLVPGFPLVFSPARGPAATSPDLLPGRICLIGSSESHDAQAVEGVRQFWELTGMQALVLDSQDFENAVCMNHFWPLLVAGNVERMVTASDLPTGSTVLKRWIEATSTSVELEKSYQLYSRRLHPLLARFREEIDRLQKSYGSTAAGREEAQGQTDDY